jgi:hypothetical protein
MSQVVFPTPMIAQLAQASKKRFHTAMLEGLTEQAAFEEIVRIILECYVEAKNG